MKFDLDRALSHRIVFIAGDEDVLRRRALDALLTAASGGDDFDLETMTGDTSGPAEWLGSCGTAPFLSPRRVALVRNTLRSDEEGDLGKPDLPESALLILVADAEIGDESRQRTLAARQKRWEKAVQAAGGFIYHASVDSNAFTELIRQEVAKHEFTIGSTALAKLQEMVGGNVSAALDEVEKVMLYMGKPGTIQEAEIQAVVVPSREWSIFALVDAVFGGDGAKALEQLKVLIGNTARPESAALSSVFPMLSRQLKLVWQARLFIEAKASLTSPPEAIRAQLPASLNLLQQKEYPQKIAMRLGQKVELGQLGRCFALICDAESRMKGLLPAFSAGDALEQLVLEMTEAVRPVKP